MKVSKKIDTLIGRHTTVEGNITFSGGLHIDGKVKGNVVADADSNAVLSVSDHGQIEGEVSVPNLLLDGRVIGDVYATERVELNANAQVTGNVYYNLIKMTMGAEVNGKLVHTTNPPKRDKQQRTEPAVQKKTTEAKPAATPAISAAKPSK